MLWFVCRETKIVKFLFYLESILQKRSEGPPCHYADSFPVIHAHETPAHFLVNKLKKNKINSRQLDKGGTWSEIGAFVLYFIPHPHITKEMLSSLTSKWASFFSCIVHLLLKSILRSLDTIVLIKCSRTSNQR